MDEKILYYYNIINTTITKESKILDTKEKKDKNSDNQINKKIKVNTKNIKKKEQNVD